ncbi:pimeloyl-ACP methyl ester carboxylesterase [Streptomyces sp. 2333.5]|uniref:alpha/beta hydrolase n=1 Tax=unclassified Streptomyces TaxID=2593676 RepID=UPI00089DA297|nr:MULTISPECIES: alpha/beta hydrolase [unclassified Streptomyces]PJJ00558.1 pimeloyl-ACP methyl ester carboxylesterase [Streptomyces sp. 2333.5]SEC00909.1 Pimeloyl-ACP methyl ester carboxylesterase [Streptomyces sp. 2314.4]SEC89982.1 Pimeloyl-ACP methyl ester carboxylesterase [Streptomyces sp. 2112.2]
MSVRLWAVAAVAALCGVFAGTPAAVAVGDQDLTPFYQQHLSWEPCGTDVQSGAQSGGATEPPGFRERLECARLMVPRNYSDPGRSTMQVQLIRLKATGPGKRLGSLVLNPGGPGASGVNYLIDSGSAFARLGQRYDIVSFDPRGTGHTDPVSCGSKLSPPPTTGEDNSLAAKEKRINEACGRYSGGLLPWVGTPNVARDMDVLRAAVHDDKLNYLGFSYGTKLGAVYAHEFPRKVGRMVLDSVEDPTKNTWQTAVAQARGFQRALDDFAADCLHGASCPLGADPHHAQEQLRSWYQKLLDTPMKVKGETVDETTYVYALREALYSRSDWPQLRQALAQLRRGDASGILRLSNSGEGGGGGSATRAGRLPARQVGRDELPPQDQLALRAISCRDTSERYGGDDFPRAERELTKASPLFGPDIAPTLLDCYDWPVAGDDSSRDVSAPGAPPMLLVATTNDPATPYQGALSMARALDNSSVVLTYRGEGHAAYTTGDPCIQRYVDDFFLNGTLPKPRTSCG